MVDGVLLDSSSPSVSIEKRDKGKLKFAFVSQLFLERWGPNKPFEDGIGGSETSHIEMSRLLAAHGHEVYSYCPLPEGHEETEYLRRVEDFDIKNHKDTIIVVYRTPEFFNQELDSSNKYWFIAQDVSYSFNDTQLSKIDRYFALCPVHYQYTCALYPQIKDKICVTSNGIRSDYIRKIRTKIKQEKIPRDPYRLIYNSSPDRGIILTLRNWFRIKEIQPKANLHIFYGWNNADRVISSNPNSHLVPLKREFDELIKQNGITHWGRIPQDRLMYHAFQASIAPVLHTFPETSFISLMEYQACGVIPVANDYWAIKQNLLNGHLYEGLPDTDEMLCVRMIDKIGDLLINPPSKNERKEMMEEALTEFDWTKFCKQWESLAYKDLYVS